MLPPDEKFRRLERARDLASWLRLSTDHARNIRTLYVLTIRIWILLVLRGRELPDVPFPSSWWRFPLGLFWILLRPGRPAQDRVLRWLGRLDYLYDEKQHSNYFIYAILAEKSNLPVPDVKGLPRGQAEALWAAWERDRRDPKNFPPDPDWLPKTNYKNDPRNQPPRLSPPPPEIWRGLVEPRARVATLALLIPDAKELINIASSQDTVEATSKDVTKDATKDATHAATKDSQDPQTKQKKQDENKATLFPERDRAYFEKRAPKPSKRPKTAKTSKPSRAKNTVAARMGCEKIAEYPRSCLAEMLAPLFFPGDWPAITKGWEGKLLPSRVPHLPHEDNLESQVSDDITNTKIRTIEEDLRQRIPHLLDLNIRDLHKLLPIPHARAP